MNFLPEILMTYKTIIASAIGFMFGFVWASGFIYYVTKNIGHQSSQ